MKIINRKTDKVIPELTKLGWKVVRTKTFDDGKSKNIFLDNGEFHSVLFCENDVVKDITNWQDNEEELPKF